MIRLARLSLALLLSIAAVTGCGDVESGSSAPGPGDPGDDDDDDEGSVTPTPAPGSWDPGPAPTVLGGMATFARTRTRAVGDLAGLYEDFVGMVSFFPVPVGPVPPSLAELWADFPTLPWDACMEVYPSSLTLSTNIDPPTAGNLSLDGPAGSLSLTPMLGVGMYVSFWNDPAKYVPMADYVLRATGGQIGAFEVTLKSPGQITTLQPDITSAAPYPIDRSAPLLLKWSSAPDGRPIYLTLFQQDSPETLETIWMCKLTDDGEFEVPASVLQNFGATVPPFPTEEWRDKMDLRRWHLTTFEVPNGTGPILSSFESGWFADVAFQ